MKRWTTLWTAYLDDRLSEADRRRVEERIRRDPSLAREAERWREIRDELHAVPTPDPGDAEDVWRHVRRELPAPRSSPAPKIFRPGLWGGLGVATAAALLALMVWNPFSLPGSGSPPSDFSTVEYVDARLDDSVPVVYTDAEAGWTVVWLSNANLEDTNEAL